MVSIYDIIISPHPTVQFRNISFEKYSAQMFLKKPYFENTWPGNFF